MTCREHRSSDAKTHAPALVVSESDHFSTYHGRLSERQRQALFNTQTNIDTTFQQIGFHHVTSVRIRPSLDR